MPGLASEHAGSFSQNVYKLMDSELAGGFPWNMTIQTKNLRGEAIDDDWRKFREALDVVQRQPSLWEAPQTR